MSADYPTTSEAYQAAQAYFSVEPSPRDLLIGKWVSVTQNTVITGTSGHPNLATLKRLTSGNTLIIDGTTLNVGSLAGAADLDAIATLVTTGIQNNGNAPFDTATCTYETDHFVVTFPATADFDGALFTGTIADDLRLDTAGGATYTQGEVADTSISAALDAIEVADNNFSYMFAMESIHDTDNAALISAWANARKVIYFADFHETQALVAGDATSRAALISAAQPSRTVGTWSAENDYKSGAVAGKLSGVRYTLPSSVITLFGKALPGRTADNITSAQREELERKNVGYYIPRLGVNMYGQGKTLKGDWADVQAWIDWIEYEIQRQVLNTITSSNRVPLTAPGVGVIKDVIEGVCRTGVFNGGIAPGTVSSAMAANIRSVTGNLSFDGVLSNGYLVYHTPVSLLSQSARNMRHSPPFSVWLKGSGAVHYVEVALTFEN